MKIHACLKSKHSPDGFMGAVISYLSCNLAFELYISMNMRSRDGIYEAMYTYTYGKSRRINSN
jgi:hypothetical protein